MVLAPRYNNAVALDLFLLTDLVCLLRYMLFAVDLCSQIHAVCLDLSQT